MSENKNFTRKCIVTNQILDESKLIRFDYDKLNNIIKLDLDRVLKGRGAYFLPSEANWQWILKFRGLNKAFKTNVSKETYEKIEKELREAKCLKKTE